MNPEVINELEPQARERLKMLLGMNPSDWTSPQLNFVRARRSYLTAETRKDLKDFLTVSKKEVEEAKKQEKEEAKIQEKEEKRSYRELQARAKELGHPKVVGATYEDLDVFVRTTEGPVNTQTESN